MSNFAERLAARSAGPAAAAGIAVLTPRPVSRFEAVQAVDPEPAFFEAPAATSDPAQADAPGPVLPAGLTQTPFRTEGRAPPPGQDPPMEEAAARPQEDVDSGRRAPSFAHRQEPPTPGEEAGQAPVERHAQERAGRPETDRIAEPPAAAPSRDAMVPGRRPEPGPPSRQIRHPQDDRADRHRPDAPAVLQGRPVMRDAAAGRARPDRGPPADAAGTFQPSISIGRIEVQFLPPQPTMPAPRPEPPRSRGFEAYARARRGEPR